MDCTVCDGEETVYGRYTGIAGSKTPKHKCDHCKGTGIEPCAFCTSTQRDEGRENSEYCSDECAKEDER